MYMSEADICKEYREAKDKNKQVQILAEQNATNTKIILDILQRGGVLSGIKKSYEKPAGKSNAAGASGGPRRKTEWTEELVDDLLRMKKEELSNEKIAERMGIDKKAIISKAYALRKRGRLAEPAKKDKSPAKAEKTKEAGIYPAHTESKALIVTEEQDRFAPEVPDYTEIAILRDTLEGLLRDVGDVEFCQVDFRSGKVTVVFATGIGRIKITGAAV